MRPWRSCGSTASWWWSRPATTAAAALYPPANDPFVITVGATDDRDTLTTSDDQVATFSAYGTTEDGFTKPDLVAPGRNIVGLLPMTDELNMGKEHRGNHVGTTYFRMSGTSVSAPMVSGAVALLLQDEPELNPDQVKYRLMATADKNWPGYTADRRRRLSGYQCRSLRKHHRQRQPGHHPQLDACYR